MGKSIEQLTSTDVASLPWRPKPYPDGGGLYLQVQKGGSRSWLAYVFYQGLRREIGLGSWPAMNLARARAACRRIKDEARAGVDPRPAKPHSPPLVLTFKAFAEEEIARRTDEWKRGGKGKTCQGWRNSLLNHCRCLHDMALQDVTTADIEKALTEPVGREGKSFWKATPVMARKTAERLESIFDYAVVKGLYRGSNPARWRGHVSKLLPKQKGMSRGHHKSLEHEAAPGFFSNMDARGGSGVAALKFTLLTNARTSETLELRWSEIDLEAAVWNLPADRAKQRDALLLHNYTHHKVPLSRQAVALLAARQASYDGEPKPSDFVFPGEVAGQPLSTGTMDAVLKRMKLKEVATVHGFRATFRTWGGGVMVKLPDGEEVPRFRTEALEWALGHVVGDATTRAYDRSAYFKQRVPLMQAWADYLDAVVADSTDHRQDHPEAGACAELQVAA